VIRRNASAGTGVDHARADRSAGDAASSSHEPLSLVHDVGGDVDRAAPLHAHVEVPPGTSEGSAVDELLQWCTLSCSIGRPSSRKAPKSAGVPTSFLTSPAATS
jgi:hypothetical protein